MKYLHELVKEELPADGRGILPEAETLNFIREGRNIVMYGILERERHIWPSVWG